jgi:hypothetical protein
MYWVIVEKFSIGFPFATCDILEMEVVNVERLFHLLKFHGHPLVIDLCRLCQFG